MTINAKLCRKDGDIWLRSQPKLVPPAGGFTRIEFDDLKKVDPCERLRMETTPENLCGRVMDLLIPLGRGQCAVIAGSAHNGQQLLLENIANSIAINHPEVEITTLLIGKNPEEATALRRSLRGEVIFSTDDEPPVRHIHLAELVLEKARRRVEYGHDAVVLLDSITNLFRAYEELLSPGESSSSGDDPPALARSKQFWHAASNTEEGGSLTLMAILDTESRSPAERSFVDTAKGAAHTKIVLDRTVAWHGILPAVNVLRSKNRNEDSLIPAEDLSRIWVLRSGLKPLSPAEAVKLLGSKMLMTRSNTHFLANMIAL